ncbi:MAG TPA: L-seryl-tRNA(Sec) selenium transferase [Terriglobales bacterium]|jgi:L-seryl-tRNA(Ser) seleniumtransferase|nr:L-seryl-tRNA(Sec) selenium transferase [Terriglobales bacterium]
MSPADLYRELPAIYELLRHPEITGLVAEEGQSATTDACRVVLARLRKEIAAGDLDEEKLRLALMGVPAAIRMELRSVLGYSLRSVINATGVILHTNLGRAPLAPSAIEHIRETALAYSNLEFELESGDRGKRDVHVDRLFRRLLSGDELDSDGRAGAPAAPQSLQSGGAGASARAASAISTIVVNNNAAAVLLALNTLAENGEVIVSRGELVEIGGSFRIPDVMTKSGAVLREVGTTNRTRVTDYERAINERTKLLLRVHRSNFEITGFTEQPDVRELVALAAKHRLPFLEDLGSGALFDLRTIGINNEPSVLDSLRAGVHVVTYSGDKLLGGPQAGLISGREDLVQKMRSNSLFRALRVDKLTYAALEATLLAYVTHDYDTVPAIKMMQCSKAEIRERAEKIIAKIDSKMLLAELVDGDSLIGGGSAPSAVLATTLIAITAKKLSASELATQLRRADTPIIARVEDGRVLLDLRTVFPAQDEVLPQILARTMQS